MEGMKKLFLCLFLASCTQARFQNPTFNAPITSFFLTKERPFRVYKDKPLDISQITFEPNPIPNGLCTFDEEAYDHLTYTCGYRDTLIVRDMGLDVSGKCGVLFVYTPDRDIRFSYALSAAKECSPPVKFSETGYWKIPHLPR